MGYGNEQYVYERQSDFTEMHEEENLTGEIMWLERNYTLVQVGLRFLFFQLQTLFLF